MDRACAWHRVDADDKMLSAARKYAEREGASSIKWHQAGAECLPFTTASYDVVLCRQGLQFFRDKLMSLKETHRVMVPAGRLALGVWRSLDRCPFLSVPANVIGRYLGVESVAAFHASCSLADRGELKDLLNNAGFRDIHIRLEVLTARYPSMEQFLQGYISVFPFAGDIAAMAPGDKHTMFNDMIESLRIFSDDFGLAAPMECHIITASK